MFLGHPGVIETDVNCKTWILALGHFQLVSADLTSLGLISHSVIRELWTEELQFPFSTKFNVSINYTVYSSK